MEEYLKDIRVWVVLLLLVDLISIGLPIAGLFLVYVVFAKPTFFKQLVDELYSQD